MNEFATKTEPMPKQPPAQRPVASALEPTKAGAQTVASAWRYQLDVWQRSVLFLDVLRERADNTTTSGRVCRRHGGKAPVLYGNCQAGWSIALLSADCQGLVGPAVLNGSPLSYWAGESDINPWHGLCRASDRLPTTEKPKHAQFSS